ncbi:MAG: DUF3383 family protein [Kiloniellales bacterium]
MANLDGAVNVEVSASAGGVDRKDFGTDLHITDDVGGGFPLLRVYDSARSVRADSDVNAPTQEFLADFGFSQSPRVRKIAIGKVDFVSPLAAQLDLLVAEEKSAGVPWYGLVSASQDEADILEVAAWAESSEKLHIPQTADAAVPAGTAGNIAEDLAGFAYDRSALIYHATAAELADLAWTAKKLAKDPDVGKTSWRHVGLTGVSIADLTDTERDTIFGNSANLHGDFGGSAAMGKGRLASTNPIDTRISRDWTKARLFERYAQLFVDKSNRNEDIPYDQDGLNLMFAELLDFLQLGENLRHFRRGSKQFVQPLIANIPSADVIARILRMEGSVILAGAIEEIDLTIAVLFAT